MKFRSTVSAFLDSSCYLLYIKRVTSEFPSFLSLLSVCDLLLHFLNLLIKTLCSCVIMARQNPQDMPTNEEGQQQLKYLEFVQAATVLALMRLAMIYGYVKDRTGPLKPGVETLEATAKTVLAPVFLKFHWVPVEFLKYVDRKVDESVTELDRHVPTNFKKVSAEALSAAKNAPETVRTMVYEVRRGGVLDTASGLAKSLYKKCEPMAKVLYANYEPKVEHCAVSAWRKLNQSPHFRQVANAVLPRAAYCTEKYNEAVRSTAEKGYRVSAYLPLVPKERIAKIFSEN